jgi:uncharacterized protein YndB with AHSA1/START domain
MTSTVTHATFTVERAYPASARRVYAAWTDPAAKVRWFGDPSRPDPGYRLDARIGGSERHRGGPPGAQEYSYQATYHDLWPERRLVFSYVMCLREQRVSASLATVEFSALPAGHTRLVYTEQGAFLDGADTPAQREHGMAELLDALGAALANGSV